MKLNWFERRGMLLTLVYLYKVGKANQTTIAKAIDITSDTLRESVLPTLKELGYIEREKKLKFPWEAPIQLTEKGRKIASLLSQTGIFSYP